MTNTERSTHPSSSNVYGSPSIRGHAADVPKDDLAAKGAAVLREAQANVESVIADAGEKGQEALNYAGSKGREALDNVRGVGETLAVAVQKSIKTRPYTTLALTLAAGFLFGATIGRRGKSSVSKSETLKNIRRPTDQRMKHQNAQK